MSAWPARELPLPRADADVQKDMTQLAKVAAKFLKSTLRLPASTFPARPPPADLAKYLRRCTDDLYSWQRQNRPADNTFRLHDGPPYANGDLHVGHALNKILKDIICRSKLAEGRRVDYTPGWDCHGLPIELKALEKHGWKRGENVQPKVIRDAARAFAQETVEKQMDGFRSWAIMGNWQNHWKTMDKDFEIRQLRVFQAMVKNDLIYRKHKPVFWSPSSGTALAEAELEYQDDHISQAAYVKFPLKGVAFEPSPVHALIWTTTPWTLPANQAIAINQTLQYALVKSEEHGLLVVAVARMDHLKANVLAKHFEVLEENLRVADLLNATYDGPVEFGQQALNRPIIHADFVSADSGTGLVHCAPGHGMEDYLALQPLIQSGRVAVRAPVDSAGSFDNSASPDNPDLLQGKNVFGEGTRMVLKLLEEGRNLVHTYAFQHKYPIDWRTKEPVMIRATAQWFADLSSIREDALNAIENVHFMPGSGKLRLRSFVENRTEWCISRQRAWGLPIPAIYHVETGEALLNAETVEHIIKAIEARGIDAWWSDGANDPAWILPGLNAAEYRRGRDTMDVWFDSGTSWTGMDERSTRPVSPLADVCLEGTDQHRGWFQSSLLTYAAHQKSSTATYQCRAPFASLITHGFTLDAQGKKMSKSLGNVISPDEIIKGLNSTPLTRLSKKTGQYRQRHPLGPDALRLWVASGDWTTDVVVSENVVKTVHTALDKYRVTFRLLLGLLKDFEPQNSLPYDQLRTLDRIALLQLAKVSVTVQQAFAVFEFHKAIAAINRYVAADLSGFYFEAIKDVLYCESATSARRLSACTTLHHILSYLQSMLAPITPLLVEETWEYSDESSRGLKPSKRTFPQVEPEWLHPGTEKLLPIVIAINSSVKQAQEEVRAKKLLGQSLASDVYVYAGPDSGVPDVTTSTWKEILVVSEVTIEEDARFKERGFAREHQDRTWHQSADVVNGGGVHVGKVVVTSPAKEKCARCWRYLAEPAAEDGGALCERCTDVIKEITA